MKNVYSTLSLIAIAAFVIPSSEIYADAFPEATRQAAEAVKRSVRVEYRIPALSVSQSGGKVRWLDFEFVRRDTAYPLTVFTGNVESGGTGPEVAASVWSAAMVSALMRGDLLTGTRIAVSFPGGIDGPSAGGMFCLAILSALDGREFPKDFAMTGTILPDGSIGLVGGVAQKIEAAAKAGIKRVCIPALGRVEEDGDSNLTDLTKVAKENGIELILVETVEEAYAAAHRLPLPGKEVLSEREILSAPIETEEVWYDNVFRDYNRCSAIIRRHGRNSDSIYTHYCDNKVHSLRLLKAGYFQSAAENAFESLLFMRAWDWSDYVFDDFLRNNEELKNIWSGCLENPDKPATAEDRKLLDAFRKHFGAFLKHAVAIPEPEKDDPDVPRAPSGIGFYRDAPWITEITAQLEPVLADEDALAWDDYFEIKLEKEIKTKDDILSHLHLVRQRAVCWRFARIRDNERAYFVEVAERIPQISGNANLMRAGAFYHSAQSAVYTGLKAGFSQYFSRKNNDRLLHRFLRGCAESDRRFSDANEGEKQIPDPPYNALARIITDCRLLALGAALQIKYGPDVGDVQGETLWANSYENAYFLNALIRTARRQALSKIKKCRDKNIPCPAAISAFVEAETSHGNRERDLLSDVLMNYWTAGNIAQALDLCFDVQPTVEQAAEQGNADALFLLGYRELLRENHDKSYNLLKKSAVQGDARAQFFVAYIEEYINKNNKAALAWVEESAQQAYLPALDVLAVRYWQGKDGFVDKDKKKAFPLFKKAAYLGSAGAQDLLAWYYINEEEIVPQTHENVDVGREWQRLAAERDCAWAQLRLAGDCQSLYENSFGAFRWFSRAAEQNHPFACAQLGDCYFSGTGVEKDEKTAVKWFKKSAELGDEYGQYRYGHALYLGKGVTEDRESGLKWLRKAAENGSEEAKKYLKDLEGTNTPAYEIEIETNSSQRVTIYEQYRDWDRNNGKPIAGAVIFDEFIPAGCTKKIAGRGKLYIREEVLKGIKIKYPSKESFDNAGDANLIPLGARPRQMCGTTSTAWLIDPDL